MARHHKLIAWEKRLKRVFDRIDDMLESKYGHLYPLHPARAGRGTTSNKAYDGLFNVGAAFTPGFGSEIGRGYIVRIRMVTLSKVPRKVRRKIEKRVVKMLRKELAREFPRRRLRVSRDGRIYKIHGDLSLGRLRS